MIPTVDFCGLDGIAAEVSAIFAEKGVRAVCTVDTGEITSGADVIFALNSYDGAAFSVSAYENGFLLSEDGEYHDVTSLAEGLLNALSSLDKCWLPYARLASGKDKKTGGVSVSIDGKELPMLPFVQEIIKNVNCAVLSSLKDTDVSGDAEIVIRIKK